MSRDVVAVDVDEAERLLYGSVTEAELAREVRRLARLLGWRYFHSFFSVRSEPGFPDVVLAKAPRLILAELKTQRGRVTPAQVDWLRALAGCPGVEIYVWRPEALPEIAGILQDGPREDLACVAQVRALLTPTPTTVERRPAP